LGGRPSRIVCVGNRLAAGDDAGPRVYDLLVERGLPDGVEAVDGGLGGLDLARFVEGARRVVFVDQVAGFGRAEGVVTLDREALAGAAPNAYGHGAGVAYLVRALPLLLGGDVPEVWLVGAEGRVDGERLEAVTRAALALATNGRCESTTC